MSTYTLRVHSNANTFEVYVEPLGSDNFKDMDICEKFRIFVTILRHVYTEVDKQGLKGDLVKWAAEEPKRGYMS